MNKIMIILLVIIIFYFGFVLAGQQKRVRSFDNVEWGGDSYIEQECYNHCNRMSENVDGYLANGWRIFDSRPYTRTENPFNVGHLTGYCRCVGVEYILESGD